MEQTRRQEDCHSGFALGAGGRLMFGDATRLAERATPPLPCRPPEAQSGQRAGGRIAERRPSRTQDTVAVPGGAKHAGRQGARSGPNAATAAIAAIAAVAPTPTRLGSSSPASACRELRGPGELAATRPDLVCAGPAESNKSRLGGPSTGRGGRERSPDLTRTLRGARIALAADQSWPLGWTGRQAAGEANIIDVENKVE